MTSNPTISLCMIVKNEEKHLRECLESVRSQVEQMVVVDTGSSDSTVEIARALGAEVHFFSWINDFAAARNESLRHAKGDWVFWMDADERLNSLNTQNCFKHAASASGIDAYSVPIRSVTQRKGYDFHYAVRFFKRFQGIQFMGAVHESIDRFLLEKRASTAIAPFVIEHLGYFIDSHEMDLKLQRNLELLRSSLEKDPENAYTLYYLGLTLIGMKEEEESYELLKRALKGKGLTSNLQALILNVLSFHHLSRKEYSRAGEMAERSLSMAPHQNTACVLFGIALYNQSRYELALPNLLMAYQFLRLPPESRRTDISHEHDYDEAELLRAIGICYARLNQFPQATAFFHRALNRGDKNPETHLLLGICYLNCKDFNLALKHLEEARALGVDSKSLALPMACAHFNAGGFERVPQWLLEAEDKEIRSTEGEALIEAMVNHFFTLNQVTEAFDFLENLNRRHPLHTRILDALGVTSIKAGNIKRAIEVHKTLLEITPENGGIARRLAALFARQGDFESAQKHLQSCQ